MNASVRQVALGLSLLVALAGCGLRQEVEILGVTLEPGLNRRVLSVEVPTCDGQPQVAVEEDEATVTLVATAKWRPFGGGDCTEFAVVELEDPLADRQILNGVTGEPIELPQSFDDYRAEWLASGGQWFSGRS